LNADGVSLRVVAAGTVLMGLLVWLLTGQRADRDVNISELVAGGALLIDTRTAEEFSGRHIDGAINIPYDEVTESIKSHAPEKSQPIVVYCRSGRRSGIAKSELEKAGYTNVVNAGGISRLEAVLSIGD
jgi:phage shock protein E